MTPRSAARLLQIALAMRPRRAFARHRIAGGRAVAKYGKTASKTVASAMRRRKKGTLRSSSGQKVTDPKQAIAIGLSEARDKGGKVPRKTSSRRSSAKKR